MTMMSEVGSRPDNKVTETDAHLLICLAAQLALEVPALIFYTKRYITEGVLFGAKGGGGKEKRLITGCL